MPDKNPKKKGPKPASTRKAKDFKVVVALMVPENIEVATETSLWTLARHPDIIARIKVEGNLGFRARNEALRQITSVFGRDYSHVLFIHSHSVFSVKDYEALKKANKPIVSGLCVNPAAPYLPNFKPLSGERMDFMPLIREYQKEKPQLIEVEEATMDFALIQREVVEACGKEFSKGLREWFWLDRDDKGRLHSENYSFCHSASEKNFATFIHPGVQVGKIAKQAVYLHNFLDYLKEDSSHAKTIAKKIEEADALNKNLKT